MAVSIGNKIELVRLEQVIRNDADKKVYMSKVFDILEMNLLQIAMPIYEGKIVPLDVGDKYSAVFYTDKGLLQCNVVISSRYKSGNLFFMEVKLLTKPEKVQRRAYYRYPCKLESKYFVLSEEDFVAGNANNPELAEKAEWNPAMILDISGGGMRVLQKINRERGTLLKVNFALPGKDKNQMFSLVARVLSSTLKEGRGELYELRMKFLRISNDDRDSIIRFIFESERNARAKESGLK